jgi:hypothetical protein
VVVVWCAAAVAPLAWQCGQAVGRGKDRGAMRQTSNLHGVSMVAVSICGGAPKLGRRWCRQGSSA